MRVFSFSFKVSAINNGKTIANALLYHAFPKGHQLLFAYDYKYARDNNTLKQDVINTYIILGKNIIVAITVRIQLNSITFETGNEKWNERIRKTGEYQLEIKISTYLTVFLNPLLYHVLLPKLS